MCSMKNMYIIPLLLCLFTTAINAQDVSNLITDRPKSSVSSFLLPKGSFQIETGYFYSENKIDSDYEFREYNLNTTLVRYGLGRSVELRLSQSLNRFSITEPDGTYNMTSSIRGIPTLIGAKVNLVPLKEKTQLSVQGMLGGNLFDVNDFDSFNTQVDFRFMVDHLISEKLSIGGNFGVNYYDESSQTGVVYSAYASRVLSKTGKLSAFAELNGVLIDETEHEHYGNVGLTYAIKPNMQIDLMTGVGLSEAAKDFTFGFGFSVLLPHK